MKTKFAVFVLCCLGGAALASKASAAGPFVQIEIRTGHGEGGVEPLPLQDGAQSRDGDGFTAGAGASQVTISTSYQVFKSSSGGGWVVRAHYQVQRGYGQPISVTRTIPIAENAKKREKVSIDHDLVTSAWITKTTKPEL